MFAIDVPDKRISLQTVGRRIEIAELDEWGDRLQSSQIVAIGAPDSFDIAELTRQFDACLARTEKTL